MNQALLNKPLANGEASALRALTAQLAEAEAAKEELDVFWRAMAEATPDAMVLADEAGELLFMNAEARRIFGRPERITDMMPKRYQSQHKAALAAFRDRGLPSPYFGQPQTFQARRRSGAHFPCEFRVNAVLRRGRWIFIATLRDVEELLQARSSWRAIADSLQVGMLLCDGNLRVLSMNPKMEKLSGTSFAEAVGRRAHDLWPHLEKNGIVKLFLRALQGDTVSAAPNRYETPQGARGIAWGTYSPFRLPNGEIAGCVATVVDLSPVAGSEALR